MKIAICGACSLAKRILAKKLSSLYQIPWIDNGVQLLTDQSSEFLKLQELEELVQAMLVLETKFQANFVSSLSLIDLACSFLYLNNSRTHQAYLNVLQVLWFNPNRYDLLVYLPLEDGFCLKADLKADKEVFKVLNYFCRVHNRIFYPLKGDLNAQVRQFSSLIA